MTPCASYYHYFHFKMKKLRHREPGHLVWSYIASELWILALAQAIWPKGLKSEPVCSPASRLSTAPTRKKSIIWTSHSSWGFFPHMESIKQQWGCHIPCEWAAKRCANQISLQGRTWCPALSAVNSRPSQGLLHLLSPFAKGHAASQWLIQAGVWMFSHVGPIILKGHASSTASGGWLSWCWVHSAAHLLPLPHPASCPSHHKSPPLGIP